MKTICFKTLTLCLVLFYVFITSSLSAQQTGAYLIPRTIFVGDPAALILPLSSAAQTGFAQTGFEQTGFDDIVLTSQSGYLPIDPNIDFHKITLERRVVGNRLIIEFTPFIPGILELPVIEIGGEYFTGLTVMVNSLIDANTSPVLSGAASTLAVPGTAFMLYGIITISIIILLLIFLFIIKGRFLLKNFIIKWKRRRLFNSIRKTEKRLQKEILKGADRRIILDKLSFEFRKFLSCLTGNNCQAMTASEFAKLHLPHEEKILDLSSFFRSCDNLRFSGNNINEEDLLKLLDDMKIYLDLCEQKEKTV